MEAGAAVLNESVIYLPQVGSTNAWAKENIAQFGPVGAVYTTDQTAGRGRLGRGWVDAPGKGLYYTAVIKTDLAQPSTLPLFASLAVCDALKQRYGIDCQIKWPNDLLLNGKKIVGILCEVAPDGHSLVVGIGINLAQPQEYFDMAGLPHGTSLLLQGVNVDLDTDPEWLAQYMTDFGFDRALYTYEEQGLAPTGNSTRPSASTWAAALPMMAAQVLPRTLTRRAASSFTMNPATPTSSRAKSASKASMARCEHGLGFCSFFAKKEPKKLQTKSKAWANGPCLAF